MLKVVQDTYRLPDYEIALWQTNLFKALPQDVSNSLLTSCKLLELPKNETLHLQHDTADWFYFILSGWVKVYRETQEGDEAVIELLGTGDFVGEFAFLEGGCYTSDAAAAEKTTLVKMPAFLLKEAATKSHATALALLSGFADKRQRQTQELEGLKLQNAPQRIGCYLLRQCGGKEMGKHRLNLPYGKSLIATQLGMKGETFSRALQKLKKATHVGVTGRKVQVPDICALAEFVCAGCSNEYPCKDVLLDPRQSA